MRVVKTDRGYIDMDHVLAVGEPYDYKQGLWGFDVTMMFLDKAKQMLYYNQDLGVEYQDLSELESYNAFRRDMFEALIKKRDEFVELWKGEIEYPPLIHTWLGKRFEELTAEERAEARKEITSQLRQRHITFKEAQGAWRELDRLGEADEKA